LEEKTIPVRIPLSQKQSILDFMNSQKSMPAAVSLPAVETVQLSVPLISNCIAAEFFSSAGDYIENRFDLNKC